MSLFPATKRAKTRFRNHLWLALANLALTGLLYVVLLWFYPDPDRSVFRWGLASGYIAAVLLAVTLSLGAWNILRGRVNAVSSDLRRDTGIWCSFFSLIHVLFGLNTHMKSWTLYFVNDAGNLRTDPFGLTNYLGAAATIIVLALLATSNDFSLRLLGRDRWKAVQRWNYVFAALVIAHSFLYQIVDKRLIPYMFIFGAITVWIAAIQFAGWQKASFGK